MEVSQLSTEQLCVFLKEREFSDQIVSSFKENDIDGCVFSDMSDEHFKEVAPKISEHIRLNKIQPKADKVSKALQCLIAYK